MDSFGTTPSNDFVADGDPFENPRDAADTAYAATVPTAGAKLGAELEESIPVAVGRATARGAYAGSSWFDRLMGAAANAGAADAGMPADNPEPVETPTLSADDANKRFAPPGTKITDGPMPEGLARVVGQQKADEIRREGVLSRYAAGHGVLTNLGMSTVGMLLDPVQVGAAFVPGLGEETIAARLGEGVLARTGTRAVAGASAGLAATAPIAAARYGLGTEQASDYGIRDAMFDMAMGSALGALGHAGFGALREGGILRPDGLMDADRARLADGLQPTAAPLGSVSHTDLAAVADAPANVTSNAMNAAAGQMAEGRAVDVAPIFDAARADKAEAELRAWTAQQGRLDTQSSAALRAADVADASAATTEARAAALRSRIADLQAQHAGFASDIADAETRRAGQVDTVTPQRLSASETEAADPATSAARRTQLENERTMLTGGRDAAADTLETARTASQIEGLQRGAAGLQAEIERTQGKADPLATKAEAQRATGSQALGAVSDRVSSQEGILQDMAARSLRRYAGAFGLTLDRPTSQGMATRVLRGGAGEVEKAMADIRGRIEGPAPAAPPASQPFDVQGFAERQRAVYRDGFAPGMPQADFDAMNAAVYGPKQAVGDSATTAEADRAGSASTEPDKGAEAAGEPARTAGDTTVAEWQAKLEALGAPVSAEDSAVIAATRAQVEAAERAAEGYAQAGECLTTAGI